MLIPLSKVKIGDEVSVKTASQIIRGHVVVHSGNLVMLAWKKGVAVQKGYGSWAMDGQRANYPEIPAKFTDGWWFHEDDLCEVILPKKTNSIGILALCIGAGASMSYVSKSNAKKVGNLNLKAGRI